jgi:small subunit ribosomal protein S16
MLTIRLQRRGRKNDPTFRVVLVEKKRAAKTGNVNEILGNYNARTGKVALEGERIKALMQNGVTVSDNLHNLLVSNKIIDAKKINILPKKTVAKVEEPAAEAPTTPEQAAAPEEIKETAEVTPEGDNAASA